MDNHPTPVEDYTTTNLVLIFANLIWILAAIWSVWGFAAVLIVATILNHLITRLDLHRRRVSAGLLARERA